jgi:Flp pilus assembly protein protease CpaA
VALLASSLIAGGVLALIYIVARRLRGDRSKTSKGIPYGIAIVAGTCFILAGQLGWMGTKSGRPPAFTVKPLR